MSHGDANDEREGELDGLLERHAEGRLGYVPPVELPPLPDDALEVDRLVAGFFAHVHALRQWAGMQPKVMFSSHWVAAKLGLHQKTVWRSLRRLEEAGVLAPAGSLPGRGGWHGPGLYLPGDGVASAVAPREGNVVNLADRRTA